MREKRKIVDGGGIKRQMGLIFTDREGTAIYRECGSPVVCVFFCGDSYDESGNWFESIESFIDSRPDDEKSDYDELMRGN